MLCSSSSIRCSVISKTSAEREFHITRKPWGKLILFSALEEVKRSLKEECYYVINLGWKNRKKPCTKLFVFQCISTNMGCSKKSLVNHIVFAALELNDYNLAITVSYQTSFQDFEKLLGFSSSTGSSTSSVWWFRRRRKMCTCGWQFFWRGGFAERPMSSGWRRSMNLGVRTRKIQKAYHFFLNAFLIDPSD